jgi:hypothetical protein
VVIGVLMLGLAIQTKRLETEKAEHASFIAVTRAAGEAAQRAAKITNEKNLKRKQEADRETEALRVSNADLSKRLRDERARRGYLPGPSPTAKNPDRISFDRAELERAIQLLDAEVSGLVAEGDAARVGLDGAKRWATK